MRDLRASAPTGFRAFGVLWVGQLASLTGSGLTGFALGVHAYRLTGSVTTLSLVYALAFVPFVLAAPFAGAVIDRWGPRRAMTVGTGGAAVVMLLFAVVLTTGAFALWQVYVLVSCLALAQSLETPALETAVPALVPKRQIGRANGLLMLAVAASRLLAPVVAGLLLVAIELPGIVLVDCASYVLALLGLAVVRIPRPAGPPGAERPRGPAGLARNLRTAWRFVAGRHGLVVLLAFSAVVNFCGGVVQLMITPLVLAFGSAVTLGTVLSSAGIGMVAAGLGMSAWGGPRRRVAAVLGFAVLMGAAMVAGSLRPDPVLIGAAAFVVLGSSAVVMACNQAIWQVKVAPELRGRVIALLTMTFSAPPLVAYAVAGPAADHVFVPLVGRNDVTNPVLRVLVGTGPGRGYALVVMVMGAAIVLCVLAAALSPRLRHLDTEMPDMITDPGADDGVDDEPEVHAWRVPATAPAERVPS